jgi:WD40 repeat protein
LNDKRIVTGSYDIKIFSIDYDKKSWTLDINKQNAHSNCIWDFCQLNNNNLVSCSEDKTIKIWKVLNNDITLLKTLNNHSSYILRNIVIDESRFASCSDDHSIKIWCAEEPYNILNTLQENTNVRSILYLKSNNRLVASTCNDLHFWNIMNYQKIYTINDISVSDTYHTHSLFELFTGNIALSHSKSPYPIVIINPLNYTIIKKISDSDYITSYSCLSEFDKFSFLYCYCGKFVQISNQSYEIIAKFKMEEKILGNYSFITSNEKKHIITRNNDNGIIILEPFC